MSEIKEGQFPIKLETEKHLKYLKELNNHQDELEYWLTEALRLNGIYWGVTAAYLLKHPEIYDSKDITKFILSCQNEDGIYIYIYLYKCLLICIKYLIII